MDTKQIETIQRKNTTDFTSSEDVDVLLTDYYQLSMAYAYWRNDMHESPSVFDLFFRKNPFKGEYTIFAGLSDCLRFLHNYSFTEDQINMLKLQMGDHIEEGFWQYLRELDVSSVRIYALKEGSLAFPRVPLIRVEGPLGVCQLLETTFLVLVNFSSLIATNAARHRYVVGPNKKLVEFGLRRAQGPDGAMTASKYAYLGGFDGTSNVRAGFKYGIPISGTHAHAFVSAHRSLCDLKSPDLYSLNDNKDINFVELVLKYRQSYNNITTNDGELAAFISYAQSYPHGFLALVDTFDTLHSGLWNFIFVSLALNDHGYKPIGIRLDSGDLAYLSRECREAFIQTSKKHNVSFEKLIIVASNDLSETIILSLKEQGHEIDVFGVGTNLVTCKSQPALGCVFKLVEINSAPRIKISQEMIKTTIPCRKQAFRLYDKESVPILDIMQRVNEKEPQVGQKILCRHPFDGAIRVYVTPSKVEKLHELVFDGKILDSFDTLNTMKQRVEENLKILRPDIMRVLNPTPYKVSVSADLFTYIHELFMSEMPIAELS